jgi:O-antigen/teichoic acid export membrane protein
LNIIGTRKSILINTLWGKANILVRYLTSFVATAIIAANYSPHEFGFYQLILTYLGIIESINLLSPIHLRNHLVRYPDDESVVASIWFFQSVAIWFLTSIVLLVSALVLQESYFWWLLLLANGRYLFRAYEYMQVVADFRLRNDLTQKIQMMMIGSFNVLRIGFALSKMSMPILVSASVVQGIFTAIYQTVLRKKIGFHFVRQFSWVKYRQLMSEGAWLSLVVFLTAVQVRIVSALSAERMSPEIFGNFQLIVKLVEPATAIGAIIFAANYTVLAHTLNKQREVFNARFLKISLLSVGISVLCGVFICVFPTSLLLRVFGAAYSSGLNNLWMGFGIILANVVLTISVQRNMILRLYLPVVLKYGGIFVCYVLLFWEMDAVSLQAALLAQFVVPILVVLGVDAFVFLSNKIRGHSR